MLRVKEKSVIITVVTNKFVQAVIFLFVLGRCLFRLSAGTPTVLTENIHDFHE
jgi:hypothetical protein